MVIVEVHCHTAESTQQSREVRERIVARMDESKVRPEDSLTGQSRLVRYIMSSQCYHALG